MIKSIPSIPIQNPANPIILMPTGRKLSQAGFTGLKDKKDKKNDKEHTFYTDSKSCKSQNQENPDADKKKTVSIKIYRIRR